MGVTLKDVKAGITLVWEFGVYSFITAFSLTSLFSLYVKNIFLWMFLGVILFLSSLLIRRKFFKKRTVYDNFRGLQVFAPVFPFLILSLIPIFIDTIFFSEGVQIYFNITLLLICASFTVLLIISWTSLINQKNIRYLQVFFSLVSLISYVFASLILSAVLLSSFGLVRIDESVVSQMYSYISFFTIFYVGTLLVAARIMVFFYERILIPVVKDPKDREFYVVSLACILVFLSLIMITILSSTEPLKETIVVFFLPKNFVYLLLLYLYLPRFLGVK